MRAAHWQRLAPPVQWQLAGPVEITSAEPGVAAALQAALSVVGITAQIVSAPSGKARLTVLTEGLSSAPMTARHWSALNAAREARAPGASILFLQTAVPDTGLEGLARTLRVEWPDTPAACYTLPAAPAASAAHLLPWLADVSGDLWLDPHGSALQAEIGNLVSPAPIPPRNDNAVWLVTGGARGVTSACALDLAALAGGTFILAGRSQETPWPDGVPETGDLKQLRGLLARAASQRGEKLSPALIDRTARAALAGLEIRTTLARICVAGARAHYMPMDTADPAAVSSGLATIHQHFGPVTGLVHGAGVIADRLVDEKTEAELARVFAPKAEGLFHLLSGLDRSRLSHIGLFSSASAFFGNRGQADYAMANAILANTGRALAAELPGALVKVFDWGPWEGGMVDAALADHFKAQGVPLIPLTDGARIFATELLAGNPEDVELIIGSIRSVA